MATETRAGTARTGPLVGVRVLEVGQAIAGPVTCALLADYGADVVKVEAPRGDLLRRAGPRKNGVPLWWKVTNRNKRLVRLDLKLPDDFATFRDLLRSADVLVSSLVPGSLARFGLDPETLERDHPRLVVVNISGFGQTGRYSGRRAFARVAEAFAGLTHISGERDRSPLHSGIPLGDYLAGLFAGIGALAALHERDQSSGQGQFVDVSMVESVLRVLESVVISYDQLGLVAERHGNDMPLQVGVGVFATEDGAWISLTGGPHAEMLARLFAMIGRPGESDRTPWTDADRRVEHRALLHGWIATWAANLSRAEAVQAGVDFQVPVAPVNTVEDLLSDEHVRDRGSVVTVDDPDLQSLRMQGVVPLFSRTVGRVRHAAPVTPEAAAGILADWNRASGAVTTDGTTR